VIAFDKVSYTVADRNIIDEVSVTMADGERVAIVGPNGAGKSTLVKMLMGQLSPTSGEIRLPKVKPIIGYMPQHLGDLKDLPNLSVLDFMLSGRQLDQITTTMQEVIAEMNKGDHDDETAMDLARKYSAAFEEFLSRGGYQAEGELLEVLIGMRLDRLDLDQPISSLSGGQKTKLAFARVLFSNPDIMVLDEPTNHLDESTINWVVERLKALKGTLIMVSHEPSVLDELVEHILFLDGTGKAAMYSGNFSIFMGKKEKLEAAQAKLRGKQEREQEKLQTFISRWRGTTRKKVAQVRDREKKLRRLETEMVDAPRKQSQISLDFPVKVEPVSKVLSVTSVDKSYGENHVLHDVSFEIYRGERVAIMGPNGAGKTTLFKTIVGAISPDSGSIVFGDRVDLGYYAQEHETLDENKTLLEEISSISRLSQTQLRSVLAHFLFPGNKVFSKVGVLSFGERSRLALAKLVVAGHNLLVLDEPTNHLDVLAREQVKEAIKLYRGTVLIVTHDREFLRGIGAEKVLLLPENEYGYLEQVVGG
jgi:ATPase subunit of ABC transporter with duplicated ATPase domains